MSNTQTKEENAVTIGCKVHFSADKKKVAIVRYIGTPHFSSGIWVGLELPDATGRNDGSVLGKRYFRCKPDYGMFVRSSSCSIVRGVTSVNKVDFTSSEVDDTKVPSTIVKSTSVGSSKIQSKLNTSVTSIPSKSSSKAPLVKSESKTNIKPPSNPVEDKGLSLIKPLSPKSSSTTPRSQVTSRVLSKATSNEININDIINKLKTSEIFKDTIETMISTNATLQNKEIAMKATIMQQENKITLLTNKLQGIQNTCVDLISEQTLKFEEIQDIILKSKNNQEIEYLKHSLETVSILCKEAMSTLELERQEYEIKIAHLENQLLTISDSQDQDQDQS